MDATFYRDQSGLFFGEYSPSELGSIKAKKNPPPISQWWDSAGIDRNDSTSAEKACAFGMPEPKAVVNLLIMFVPVKELNDAFVVGKHLLVKRKFVAIENCWD